MRPFLGPRIECGVTSLHRSSRHRYHIRTSLIVSRKSLNTAEAVDYSVIPRYDAESRNARKSAVTGPRIMCGVTCRAEAVGQEIKNVKERIAPSDNQLQFKKSDISPINSTGQACFSSSQSSVSGNCLTRN